MRKFGNKLMRWLRGLWGLPAEELRPAEPAGCAAEWWVERTGREAERTFAWHGMEGHEWEAFEE